MSFGQWYEQQQQQQQQQNNNENESASSSFSFANVFNISNNEGNEAEGDEEMGSLLPNLSSMKQTLEQQLPNKILGMNYQQRFQVCTVLYIIHVVCLLHLCSCFIHIIHIHTYIHTTGILCNDITIHTILLLSIYNRCANVNNPTSKICDILFNWIIDIYVKFCIITWPICTFQ